MNCSQRTRFSKSPAWSLAVSCAGRVGDVAGLGDPAGRRPRRCRPSPRRAWRRGRGPRPTCPASSSAIALPYRSRRISPGLIRGLGQPVEPGQLGDGVGGVSGVVAVVLPAPEDHAELRAPVAQVVVADDLVAERRVDPRQALADHGRAEVADVHRLGDVGRRVVDHDRLRLLGRSQAQVGRRRADSPSCSRDPVVREPDVEEARPGDLGRAGHRGEVDGLRRPRRPARAGSSSPPWRSPCSRWPGSRRTWGRCSSGRPARRPAGRPPRESRRRRRLGAVPGRS